MNNCNTTKGFINWLASAKGIGVILVVIGHFLASSNLVQLNKFIYTFHMPMFFAISGYLYNISYTENL